MSEPLKAFLDVANEENVDKQLMKLPDVKNTLNKLERLGKDLGETAENLFKRPPLKPSGATPTYQESAFLKPKKETTLYNVTNQEKDIPIITKASKILKKTSYSIRCFSGAATYKQNQNSYSLIFGERVGFEIGKDTKFHDTGVKVTYKVTNQKTSLEYYSKSKINSHRISVFNQGSNIGVTAHYSNHNGLSSAVSIDKDSASAECSYNKQNKMCKMELGAYATSGENYSNPFVGVRGRISF